MSDSTPKLYPPRDKHLPDGDDDRGHGHDSDTTPQRNGQPPLPSSPPAEPLRPESKDDPHDGSPSRPTGRGNRWLGDLGQALSQGPIAVIDGFGDASGPWLTDQEKRSGIGESLRGPYDSVNHLVLTALDMIGRIGKKAAALILLRFMRIPALRDIARRIFRFAIWSEAATKFASFYDIIGVFAHNRFGSPQFLRKLPYSIFLAAATLAAATAIEHLIVAPLLILAAAAGWPVAVVIFVLTPALACLSYFVSDYAVKRIGSWLFAALSPIVGSVVSGIYPTLASWWRRLFGGSSEKNNAVVRSPRRRAPINILAKRSRMLRRFRRIIPRLNSDPPPWGPGRFQPDPVKDDPPGPPPPPAPAGDDTQPPHNGAGARPDKRKPRPARNRRPRVGGVLFEHCDEVLTGIEEINGAYRDPATGSLVLVGKAAANEDSLELSLEPADLDHMFVALRAAIMGEPMGVSIDPPAGYRYSEEDRMLPDKSPLLVSYLGGCAGTLAGAIFFEADRIMKCLSIGRDNCERSAFSSQVPGYQSTFDMGRSDGRSGTSWHRFWFVVDRVEIRKSADNDGFVFGDVKIALKTEMQIHGEAAGEKVDPTDAQFAAHLTDHYDEYAREFPVLSRLKELAKVASIASFFANHLGPMDWGALLDAQTTSVDTPSETPSIRRSEATVQGRGIYTRKVSGGVDMNVILRHKIDSADDALRLTRLAAVNRPAAARFWDFADGANRLRATTVPMASRASFRPLETDHQFDHDLRTAPDFALKRIYLGASAPRGLCGPGWDIFVPYSLSISIALGKRAETLDSKNSAANGRSPAVIFLKEAETGAAYVYRKITNEHADGDHRWALVRPSATGNDKRSFEYYPTDCIDWRDNHYVIRRGHEYHFDASGRLIEVFFGKSLVTKYNWNAERLASIEDGLGRRYSLSFNLADQRLDGVMISDGQTINYRYGPDGTLLEAKVNARVNSQYGYDSVGRLTEIIDPDGRVTARATYNATGVVSNNASCDEIRLDDGGVIKRYLDNGRADLVRDAHGTKARFSYFSTGHLMSISVTNPATKMWRFEYGANRTLKRVIDPRGRVAETTMKSLPDWDHPYAGMQGKPRNQLHYASPVLDIFPFSGVFASEA